MRIRVGVALTTGALAAVGAVGLIGTLPASAGVPSGVSAGGSPSASPSPSTDVPAVITADEAKAIALTASGGGTITKFEFKDEHGEYRVEIQNGRTRHKLRIDAYTGEITRHDVN
ncbi:MAG: PepSY domain-containing protein [Actinoplanes sp.]